MAPRGKDVQKDMAIYAEKLQQWAAEYGKPLLQYGFIPAIIIAGMMFTKPKPTVAQLLFLA